MTNCSAQKLSSMHFYGWQLGLKTGQYYLRTKAAVEAIKFTVDSSKQSATTTTKTEEKPKKKASKYSSVGDDAETAAGGAGGADDAMKRLVAEQDAKSKYECVGCGS